MNKIADSIADDLSGKLKVLDRSMAETAFRALEITTPANMKVGDSRRTADAIGCDFVLLVHGGSLRRTSLSKGEYFESYIAIYLISERSGRLVSWDLISFEADDQAKAENLLFGPLKQRSELILDKLKAAEARELSEKSPASIEQLPLDYSPQDKAFRPPIPYRRIKPEYTAQALGLRCRGGRRGRGRYRSRRPCFACGSGPLGRIRAGRIGDRCGAKNELAARREERQAIGDAGFAAI